MLFVLHCSIYFAPAAMRKWGLLPQEGRIKRSNRVILFPIGAAAHKATAIPCAAQQMNASRKIVQLRNPAWPLCLQRLQATGFRLNATTWIQARGCKRGDSPRAMREARPPRRACDKLGVGAVGRHRSS